MEFETKTWIVTYEMFTAGKNESAQDKRTFYAFEAALEYARQLSQSIDLSPCLTAMRNDEGFEYRNKMADFIAALISNCAYFDKKSAIPSFDPKDYAVPKTNLGYKKQDNGIGKDFKIKTIALKKIEFKYDHGAKYHITTNIEYLKDNNRSDLENGFKFNFCCENEAELTNGQISKLTITLKTNTQQNRVRHAVKILELLRQSSKPLKQTEIMTLANISDRKTVWYNIKKLIEAGYDIRRDDNLKYYIPKTKDALTLKDIKILRESVELNHQISPDDKERIIRLLSKM